MNMEQVQDDRPYAHAMLEAADKDFQKIDLKHSNQLNLVDIMAYETIGPRQKEIGEFLEYNFPNLNGFELSGIGKPLVTRDTLKRAEYYTRADDDAVAKEEQKNVLEVAKKVVEADGIFFGTMAGALAVAVGPESLLLTAPLAAAATAGMSALAYNVIKRNDKQLHQQAFNLHKPLNTYAD